MAKKKKTSNTKNSSDGKIKERNIASNSLLPARTSGEKPDMPFSIKTEVEENSQHSSAENSDIQNLFTFVENCKNNVNFTISDTSNHSNTSTATEPMEVDESCATLSNALNSTNQVEPTSFTNVFIKEETDNNVMNYCSPPETTTNNIIANGPVKEERVSLQDLNTTNIQTEPPRNSNKGKTTKRKPDSDLEEKLEALRKRIKAEPANNSENLSLTLNVSSENHEVQDQNIPVQKEATDYNEKSNNIEADNTIDDDDDDDVLPLPEVKKIIPVITLSDEEDDGNESEDREPNQNAQGTAQIQTSFSTSPTKPDKIRNFSTDILQFFSVVSELDRFECDAALKYLSKYKTKSSLEDFFPLVKKESKNVPDIKKGDILFRKVITQTHRESENTSLSLNADNIANKEMFLSKPLLDSQYGNFLSTYQSSPLPATSTALNPNITISFEQMQKILNAVQITDINSKLSNNECNGDASDLHQTSFSDPCFKKKNLNTAIVHPQVPALALDQNFSLTSMPSTSYAAASQISSPSSNHTFQSLSQPSTSYAAASQVSSQSFQNLPQPSTSFAAAFQITSPSSNHTFDAQPSTSYAVSLPPPTSLSNKDFQKLPVDSSYVLVERMVSSLSMPQDPRLSAKKITFARRKGENNLLLYHNVGKDDVTSHFETLILQWNPSWMETQLKTGNCPPICYAYHNATLHYANEMAYYNTYVPLHLLELWFNIYECFKQNAGVDIHCIVKDTEVERGTFRIFCTAELEDNTVWPKRDDIVYCEHNNENAFLCVHDVRKRETLEKTKKKLKISLRTFHNFKFSSNDEIRFRILLNIRPSCMQIESLKLLCPKLQNLVLRPERYKDEIETVKLNKNKLPKPLRDDILKAFYLATRIVILVETFHMCDTISLISLVSYCIVKGLDPSKSATPSHKPAKILIVLKSVELLIKLFRRLHHCNPILAVRTKQILLPDVLKQFTIEDQLENKKNLHDILDKHHVFLSTFSALGQLEKSHLNKLKGLICIIDETHLCTEVETALPLTLDINKLLLFGTNDKQPYFPSSLSNHNYHLTLFHRLWRSKMKA